MITWKKEKLIKSKWKKQKRMKRKMGEQFEKRTHECKSFYRCIMYFSNTISNSKRYCNKRFKQGKVSELLW